MLERERLVQIAAGVVLAALAAPATPAEDPFSIEDVLSAPYPTSLVAAARAERIAWTENERGARSLWTAAAPDFRAERLVLYEEDDGQAVGELALTPDGSLLVYVRGGAPNSSGEIPNPASLPGGVEQAIWAVRTSGGEPWRLAAGAGAVVLPEGRSLLFARGGAVFEVPIRHPDDGEATPARLFEVRRSAGSLTPAPDGGRLAFVSRRGDHSFVGVFHREDGRIVWMAPGFDRHTAPAWSGDGERLAFLRLPGVLMGERFDYDTRLPFAVWVGDADSGAARQIWSSPDADGGFAQLAAPWALKWAGGDRLVFSSEAGGWLHYWSVAATGGDAVELTPGDGIVEWAALTADGGTLVFSGNAADAHARHLWSVPTGGGAPERLTRGAVVDTDPVLAGEWIAFRRATHSRPPAISVMPAGGGSAERVSRSLPSGFPADALIAPEVVAIEAADGLTARGQLFAPSDAGGVHRPAVIYLHGGPIRQMLPAFHYRGYYANAYAFNQYLASRGYVVLALNFRSGIGYGRSFRAAPDQGPRGASEYRDVVAAARYLRRRGDVDPDRIGLWGGSYGGYLTALGLARDSHLFAAGVDLHGVHDWAHRAEHYRVTGGAWGLQPEDYELARRASPVFDLASWSSPVLMIHGDDDRNVDFIQSTDLVQRLRRRGVHVETLVFPDEVHGFLRHASWLEAFRRADDFLHRFLGASDRGR